MTPTTIERRVLPFSLAFHTPTGERIGTLSIMDGNLVFDGNVEESARVLFDHVIALNEAELDALRAQVAELGRDAERWRYIDMLCGHGDVHIVCEDDGLWHLHAELAEVQDVHSVGDTPAAAIDAARELNK